MFWKSDKPASASWSITHKLILLYTLSAFGILLIASLFLYWVLENNLDQEDNQFLADQVNVLRVILSEHPNNKETLEEEVNWEGAARRYEKYYIRILDESGNTLTETSRMSEMLLPSIFPPPLAISEEPEEGEEKKLPDGKTYLLMSAWAAQDNFGLKQQLIQIALDISHDDTLLADYRRKSVIVLFLGILCSAAAGAFVARKGMKPLEEITKRAERITAAQLHERIDPSRWPTELKTLATAFDQMLARLEDSFIRLSQFSADLAHELRTPINNLMGEAEVGLAKPRSVEEYREVLGSSLEELERLARMIDSLLFLARADNVDTQIQRSRFNALKEVEAVRDFHEAVADEKQVTVTCSGDALLNADPILFRRAISNLLTNSLQYTPSGGKINFMIKQSDHQFVEVKVSDTGLGIGSQHLPKIFDRFYRADQARSQNPQGTGLGLAIVKSIMDLHKGKVAIDSKLNQGTTVTLHFPVVSVK